VKLSPALAVFVEIVELVQTEIGVPAASVKTRGGAGGGAADEDEPDDELTFDAPVLDEVIPGFDGLPFGFVAAEPVGAEPSAGMPGEAAASGVGLPDIETLVGEVAFFEEQAVCANSRLALNTANRKILPVFEFIKPSLFVSRVGGSTVDMTGELHC
jgi:hypothetical protein